MFVFLLLSNLLLLLGLLVYHFLLRRILNSSERKILLLSIVVGSLAFPAYFTYHYQYRPPQAFVVQQQATLNEDICSEFCPQPETIDACMAIAQEVPQFCNCHQLSKHNLIIYHNSPWYNFLVWQENALPHLWIFISILTLLLLVLQLYKLSTLIKSCQKSHFYLDNLRLCLLTPSQKQIPVGSFRLWRRYIIWQNALNELSEEEKNAVLWHECAHIQQGDTWLKIALKVLQGFWFANPAFYYLRNEFERISEFIADETALRHFNFQRKNYALLLLKVERSQYSVSGISYFNRHLLQERISHILQPPTSHFNLKRSVLAWASFLVFWAGMATASEISAPLLETQKDKLRIYETLCYEHESSGRAVFCAHCLVEEVCKISDNDGAINTFCDEQ
ncbi:MAG: M56 family metallopeptidase [Chitinophagales bacterium]|nr:M56 family metallopeptidase [Bacteroidota bacterium]MCB9042236.1 M56 family metallopeptidase [Chitinophagales bacterium]